MKNLVDNKYIHDNNKFILPLTHTYTYNAQDSYSFFMVYVDDITWAGNVPDLGRLMVELTPTELANLEVNLNRPRRPQSPWSKRLHFETRVGKLLLAIKLKHVPHWCSPEMLFRSAKKNTTRGTQGIGQRRRITVGVVISEDREGQSAIHWHRFLNKCVLEAILYEKE